MPRKQMTMVEAYYHFCYDPDTGILRYNHNGKNFKAGEKVNKIFSRGGVQYHRHRVIYLMMTGEWPAQLVDHANGDHEDDRWINLRAATHRQNQFNKKGHGKYPKGVVFKADTKRSKPWSARIRIDGKKVALGSFATMEEAELAYNEAAKNLHKEFDVNNRSNLSTDGKKDD